MPILSPKIDEHLVLPRNRPDLTMPVLSPCQSLSPDSTVRPQPMTSLNSGRQLFSDNKQLSSVHGQSSTKSRGEITNNMSQSTQFVDHQEYRMDQKNMKEHSSGKNYILDQQCHGQVPNNCISSISPSEKVCVQRKSQGQSPVLYKFLTTDLGKSMFVTNQTLDKSKARDQIKVFCGEVKSKNVCQQTAPTVCLHTGPRMAVSEQGHFAGTGDGFGDAAMVADKYERYPAVCGQTGQQQGQVSIHPPFNPTKNATQPGQIGQHLGTFSAPLGQQMHVITLSQIPQLQSQLHSKTSGLQGPGHSSQSSNPELNRLMMAENSPSKFVVTKIGESNKYVILSPEKSSGSYNPVCPIQLPPGKYRLHTVKSSPAALVGNADQGQEATKGINSDSLTDGVKTTSKSEGKTSKKKSSSKQKTEDQKERKRKQQLNKSTNAKKTKSKTETKKIGVNDEKKKANVKKTDKKLKSKLSNKAEGDKVKKLKAKNPKVKEQKGKDSKGNDKSRKKTAKSEPAAKKSRERKDDMVCRVLSPCQKFCKAVVISYNKDNQLIHTACSPVLFFTGGQFSKSPDLTLEEEQPVYLLTEGSDNQIMAIMSKAFNPGQFLVSSERLICEDNSSDIHRNEGSGSKYHLYQAILSPYHFSLTSPMKGHKVIVISQYKAVCIDSPEQQDNAEIRDRPDPNSDAVDYTGIINDVIESWEQSCDVTTMAPCTHPLYEVINEILKKKTDAPAKTCKFKLRVQLFDSRRQKRQRLSDEGVKGDNSSVPPNSE